MDLNKDEVCQSRSHFFHETSGDNNSRQQQLSLSSFADNFRWSQSCCQREETNESTDGSFFFPPLDAKRLESAIRHRQLRHIKTFIFSHVIFYPVGGGGLTKLATLHPPTRQLFFRERKSTLIQMTPLMCCHFIQPVGDEMHSAQYKLPKNDEYADWQDYYYRWSCKWWCNTSERPEWSSASTRDSRRSRRSRAECDAPFVLDTFLVSKQIIQINRYN